MLASWTLDNFKSVGRELTLPFSPITLLVGANSAGKSSIIQSILLVKQTLQYATADRPIALNGPLLKLGNYNDIKNVLSATESFKIGWKYDAQFFNALFPSLAIDLDVQTILSPYRQEISVIECETIFEVDRSSPQSELALLQPVLKECKVYVAAAESEDIRAASLGISRSHVPLEAVLTKKQPALPSYVRPSEGLRYLIDEIDHETKASILEDHPNGEIIAAVTRHFFPVFAAVKFDLAIRRATHIADAIVSLRKTLRFQREYSSLKTPAELVALIQEWRGANAEFFPKQESLFDDWKSEDGITFGALIDQLNLLKRRSASWGRANISFPSLQELQPKIVEILTSAFNSEIEIELQRLRLISEAGFFCREYFESYVRYLGPLRDEPKPLYPLEALSNPTDVGFRGENTAAVLHLNQYTRVSYLQSTYFQKEGMPSLSSAAPKVATLQAAVVDWLSYMGVVEGVSTGDRGKIGHDLQVKTPGLQKFHDLTNVGVGVSQVLPIVLMALLAPAGSVLIFEQPELHLHPRVQTRLADFFISIALAGKQCIVETHSEYLIHRLRRRIAEAPDEELTKLSKLYFVEREGGLTSCREVDITKYGAITDWPVDFFDQSQVEAERILQAASAKRAAERRAARKE